MTTEHQEQCALFEWAALNETKYPELRWMFAVPNGGKRHISVAVKMKAEGVKRGVPDILCVFPSGCRSYIGLAIEMKSGKNKTTPEQNEWLSALENYGWAAVVCHSWQEAAEVIVNYLN